MASAAEQLASSINLSAFSKATELKSRIWFTLGALVIYRLGTTLPGWLTSASNSRRTGRLQFGRAFKRTLTCSA